MTVIQTTPLPSGEVNVKLVPSPVELAYMPAVGAEGSDAPNMHGNPKLRAVMARLEQSGFDVSIEFGANKEDALFVNVSANLPESSSDGQRLAATMARLPDAIEIIEDELLPPKHIFHLEDGLYDTTSVALMPTPFPGLQMSYSGGRHHDVEVLNRLPEELRDCIMSLGDMFDWAKCDSGDHLTYPGNNFQKNALLIRVRATQDRIEEVLQAIRHHFKLGQRTPVYTTQSYRVTGSYYSRGERQASIAQLPDVVEVVDTSPWPG